MMEADGPRSGRLTHLGILRFTGPDALNFLQGQLTNDTQRLTANHALLAAYLNPQGRVLAVMRLLPHSTGTLAILPRELLHATGERMRKYILRAKVKIDEPGETLVVAGCHGSAALAEAALPVPENAGGYVESNGVGVAKIGHESRYWVIAPPATPLLANLPGHNAEAVDPDTGFDRHWRLADIQAGLPQVYGATAEAFVAQMLNLDRLDGISFSKGCYTGQEIVARTQHLGRIKRRMFHLRLPRGEPSHPEWRIGETLTLSDGRPGRIADLVETDGKLDALAVLSLDAPPASEITEADGSAAAETRVPAVQVPLPYALE